MKPCTSSKVNRTCAPIRKHGNLPDFTSRSTVSVDRRKYSASDSRSKQLPIHPRLRRRDHDGRSLVDHRLARLAAAPLGTGHLGLPSRGAMPALADPGPPRRIDAFTSLTRRDDRRDGRIRSRACGTHYERAAGGAAHAFAHRPVSAREDRTTPVTAVRPTMAFPNRPGTAQLRSPRQPSLLGARRSPGHDHAHARHAD
jgi:hypothetical protein